MFRRACTTVRQQRMASSACIGMHDVTHPSSVHRSWWKSWTSSTTRPIESWWNETIQWIKRTYQPSVTRRQRRHGYLKRSRTVGGRKVIQRRLQKKRWRIGV